jgi:hypothetical protein
MTLSNAATAEMSQKCAWVTSIVTFSRFSSKSKASMNALAEA